MADHTSTLEVLAERLDRSRMAEVIRRLPDHIEIALSERIPETPVGPFKRVFIVAMGGSALPGDVLKEAFRESLYVPVTVVRDYSLTLPPDHDCLVIANSFSGSTEETLSALKHLPTDFRHVVAVTAGTELAAVASRRGYPVLRVPIEHEPPGFQPRSAIAYCVTFFARILMAAGVMADVTSELAAIARHLRNIEVARDALDIALWLRDRIPAVYTDQRYLMSVARVAKIKFNENAKSPAVFNALPELNHNEMIGFVSRLVKFGILYLSDDASNPRLSQRFRVMRDVFESEGLDHVEFRAWQMRGATTAQKVFSAIAFAEHCSYALALLSGHDPTPVDLIEHFKTALASGDRALKSGD